MLLGTCEAQGQMDAKGLHKWVKGALGSGKHVAWPGQAVPCPPTSLRNEAPNSQLRVRISNFLKNFFID